MLQNGSEFQKLAQEGHVFVALPDALPFFDETLILFSCTIAGWNYHAARNSYLEGSHPLKKGTLSSFMI